jgi:hypothetical protein
MEKFSNLALLGVAGLLVLAIGIILLAPQPVESQVFNESWGYCNVTVNVVIDASLSGVPIDFGSVNPGTTGNLPNPADNTNGWPANVTVYANTNTDWNLSVYGSGPFTYGGYSFGLSNLTYSNSSTGTFVAMDTAPASPFPDWVLQLDPSVDTNRTVYFKLSIPPGQTAGTYSTQVYFNVTQAS